MHKRPPPETADLQVADKNYTQHRGFNSDNNDKRYGRWYVNISQYLVLNDPIIKLSK